MIVITRFDGGLALSHSPVYIQKYLRYQHRGMEMVNFRRMCTFTEKLLYTKIEGQEGLITLPGFYEQIVDLLDRNKEEYTVVDHRSKMPDIDWDRVRKIKLRDYQIPLVAEMLVKAQDTSGIIDAAGGIGKTFLQMITYAAWNKCNTILAIPLKEVALQTHAKFKQYFPEKHIGLMGAGSTDVSNDITITTFRSIKNCSMEKCELLMIDELQSSTSDGFQEALKAVTPKRMLGFSATTTGLFNNADKLIKGMYGENLIHFPYEDAEAEGAVVPGVVYMISMPDNYISKAGNYTEIESKIKYGIKQDAMRSEIVGRVCNRIPEGWQTIIFVDHVKDHMVDLFKYLPKGTRYLHRDASKKSVGTFALTTKEQNENIRAFSNNEFQYLIASDAFRAGVDIPNCRVVIQAAGGSSKVEVLQEAYRGSRILTDEQREKFNLTEKTHFVLVDFLDNHDPVLEGMAKKRMKHYEEQGWKINIVEAFEDIDFHKH